MLNSAFELVTLRSGIKSLRLRENNETFHPGIGPLAEARILHTNQHELARRGALPGKLVLWDVGLGAAANAIAAIEALGNPVAQVELHSFDKTTEPLEFALANAEALAYPLPHLESLNGLLRSKQVALTPNLNWFLHLGDFRETLEMAKLPKPDSIFYDPYSPTSNLEMWTLDHFTRLRSKLDGSRPCLMTNYTRSTTTRITWLLAGFYVGIGCTIGEKEETSLASVRFEDLKRPLTRSWLENRVKISHRSAPIRGPLYQIAPISPSDFELLTRHPQFLA